MSTVPVPPLPADPKGWAPWAVALFRGVLEAVLLAFLGWVIVWLGGITTGDLAPFALPAILAVRSIEGIVDQKVDPSVQRVGGGKAASQAGQSLVTVAVVMVFLLIIVLVILGRI